MNTAALKRWLSGLTSPTRRARQPSPRFGEHGLWIFRFALAAVSVALLTFFSPFQRPYSVIELRVGSIAPERITAPLPFFVRKSPEEFEREQLAAERTVPTILRRLDRVKEIQLAHLDSVYSVLIPNMRMQMPDSLKLRRLQRELPHVIGSLSETTVRDLTKIMSTIPADSVQAFQVASARLLADVYSTGVIASKEDPLAAVTERVRVGASEQSIDALYEEAELKLRDLGTLIESYGSLAATGASEAVQKFLGLFVESNLVVDVEETSRLRDEAGAGIAKIKGRYLQDELIIDQNTKVEAVHVEALEALAAQLAEEELKDPTTRHLQTIAAAVVASFIILVFGYYLATREPQIFASPSQLLLLAIITLVTAGIASYIEAQEIHIYYVPTPLAAMLVTILLSPSAGLIVSFLLALFIGSLFGDFYVALICALTSAVAVYSVRHVRHRNQFYRAIILLPISYAALIAATDLIRFVEPEQIYRHVFPGVFTGVVWPIVIQGLLPIFESLFHITTDITLLELSDLNRPLLRELAIRAPGTYTHSLIMANLSEAAGEAIRANPLLARVGCYYHDIGKMLKPEYFSENQGLRGGRNPHDHLTPSMSILIIDSHVKDGIELAEENGLPKAIIDLIPEHHGTTVIEYFYNRAIELGVENVRVDDFRYDGPKPQSREAGILMLADSVESAARTLGERTPDRVRQLVRNIIQQKFTAGELDECPLTLRDLHKIEDSFVPVLIGTLHGRTEYPWQKKEDAVERRELADSVQPRRS